MSQLYIDTGDRRRIATFWIQATMWFLHGCAFLLLLAAISDTKGQNGDTLAAMFATVCTGIGATLLILLVDKGSDIVLARFANPAVTPAEVTETITKTTVVAPPAGVTIPAQDVNIQAEGDVSVSKN